MSLIGRITVLGGLLSLLTGALIFWQATARLEAAENTPEETPDAGVDSVELPAIERPAPEQPVVYPLPDPHLIKTPVRQTRGLDLVKMGWSYNCMDCHKLIEPKWHYDREMVEHSDIVLNHGNNRFCLNCHHPTNRNAFVDYDGSEIAEEDVVDVCAKCHGPKKRDWEAGVHGRQNGYWDQSRGPRTKLKCIQCHDPHSPQFRKIKPLASPTYPPRAAKPRAASGHH